MKFALLFSLFFSLASSCTDNSQAQTQSQLLSGQPQPSSSDYFIDSNGDTIYQVVKTEAEWKSELTSQEFYVLREAGTERAGTGDLLKEKRAGVFTCAACGLVLFDSNTKFESGTGWPSFYQPADPSHVGEHQDNAYGMVRTEVVCNRCGGHLGHVFPDGPPPTGQRYCINAVSLDFVPAEGQ
ncbi:MAG: peptide-methionine (R)-S-oxide reductase MsrB [Saprospiraceae bacterium]|nr:peptide-methionine (R)-S-oxide reductase MsrB [Saprospiraceae bacterium]